MFIKPIIDTIINEAEKDPIDPFIIKANDKTMGKKFGSNEVEIKLKKAFCDYCDKVFFDSKGLNIHIGRVHKESKVPNNPPVSKKKRQWEECDKSDTMCHDCGQEFTAKEALRWHIGKCQKRIKTFHDTRKLTPANKKSMSKTELLIGSQITSNEVKESEVQPNKSDESDKKVSELCAKCNLIVEAQNNETLLTNMNNHNSLCKVILEKKQPENNKF